MEINEPAVKYSLFPKMTAAEYLDWEREQEERHEYISGEVYAVMENMAGAALRHTKINSKVFGEIMIALKGKPCEAFVNDVRVQVKSAESYFYPDITIVCEEMEIQDDELAQITNPSIVIEILSPSTQRKDMGKKKFFYMQIPSLKEYIMIDSQSVSVETIRRRNDGTWENLLTLDMNDTLFINTINFQMPLVDIYANIKF